MSVEDPGIAPWSDLEGREIAKAIKEAEGASDVKTAEKLKIIDRRARLFTGDKPPEYDK